MSSGNTSASTALRPVAVSSRPDPSDGLRDYTGGFDATSSHYWASLSFTGFWACAFAFIWSIIGLIVLISVICKSLKARKAAEGSTISHERLGTSTVIHLPGADGLAASTPIKHGWVHNAWFFIQRVCPALAEIALAALAIMTLVWIVSAAGHVRDTIDVLASAANGAVDDARNVSTASQSASEALYSSGVDDNAAADLASLAGQLEWESIMVEREVRRLKPILETATNAAKGVTAGLAALALLLVLLTSFCLRVNRITVPASWMLVVLALAFAGAYIVGFNASRDACRAMNEYLADPTNTTWDKVLPCDTLNGTRVELEEGRQAVNQLVEQVNVYIQLAGRVDSVLAGIPAICEPLPFVNSTQSESNAAGSNGSCIGIREFINTYGTIIQGENSAAFSGIQILEWLEGVAQVTEAYPRAEGLAECAFITDAFTTLTAHQCRPLQSSLHALWILLVLGSTIAVVLLLWFLLSKRHAVLQDRSDYRAVSRPRGYKQPLPEQSLASQA